MISQYTSKQGILAQERGCSRASPSGSTPSTQSQRALAVCNTSSGGLITNHDKLLTRLRNPAGPKKRNKLLRAFSLLSQDTQPELLITIRLQYKEFLISRGNLSPMTKRQRYSSSSVNCRARGRAEYNIGRNTSRSFLEALHSNNVCWIVSSAGLGG